MSKVLSNQGKYCRWVFTHFKYDTVKDPETWSGIKFCRWQLELCPSTERLHLQGAVWFTSKRTLAGLRHHFPRVHWEPMMSQQGSLDYTCKEETRVEGPWEIGTPPSQGKRTDWIALKQDLDKGVSLVEVSQQHFPLFIRYSTGIQKYHLLRHSRFIRGRPEILIVYGDSGLGKTRTVREAFPNAYWLEQPPKNSALWFDGYNGESTIIIDEFFGWISYNALKRLLDYGQVKVKVHGGMVPLFAHKWVFTSNTHPSNWYPKVNDPSNALMRRLKEFSDVLRITQSSWIWEAWEDCSQSSVSNRYVPY